MDAEDADDNLGDDDDKDDDDLPNFEYSSDEDISSTETNMNEEMLADRISAISSTDRMMHCMLENPLPAKTRGMTKAAQEARPAEPSSKRARTSGPGCFKCRYKGCSWCLALYGVRKKPAAAILSFAEASEESEADDHTSED